MERIFFLGSASKRNAVRALQDKCPGRVDNRQNVTRSNCDFNGTGTNPGYGDAIYIPNTANTQVTLTLTNVRFFNCHASWCGGAVYSDYALNGNISKCVFEGCTATYV